MTISLHCTVTKYSPVRRGYDFGQMRVCSESAWDINGPNWARHSVLRRSPMELHLLVDGLMQISGVTSIDLDPHKVYLTVTSEADWPKVEAALDTVMKRHFKVMTPAAGPIELVMVQPERRNLFKRPRRKASA